VNLYFLSTLLKGKYNSYIVGTFAELFPFLKAEMGITLQEILSIKFQAFKLETFRLLLAEIKDRKIRDLSKVSERLGKMLLVDTRPLVTTFLGTWGSTLAQPVLIDLVNFLNY
jgi:hypothetical protein